MDIVTRYINGQIFEVPQNATGSDSLSISEETVTFVIHLDRPTWLAGSIAAGRAFERSA